MPSKTLKDQKTGYDINTAPFALSHKTIKAKVKAVSVKKHVSRFHLEEL